MNHDAVNYFRVDFTAEDSIVGGKHYPLGAFAAEMLAFEWNAAADIRRPLTQFREEFQVFLVSRSPSSRNSRRAPMEHGGCFQLCLQKMSKKMRRRTVTVYSICYNSSIMAPQSIEICTQMPPIRRRYQRRAQGQGPGDVGDFQMAGEGGCHPHLFRQPLLGQAPELSAAGDFQSDLTALFLVNYFHAQFLQRPPYGCGLWKNFTQADNVPRCKIEY